MTAEPSTHSGFGNSVEPFRVKRLRRESSGIPDVCDQCPDFMGGHFHVNCHRSVHGKIIARREPLSSQRITGCSTRCPRGANHHAGFDRDEQRAYVGVLVRQSARSERRGRRNSAVSESLSGARAMVCARARRDGGDGEDYDEDRHPSRTSPQMIDNTPTPMSSSGSGSRSDSSSPSTNPSRFGPERRLRGSW